MNRLNEMVRDFENRHTNQCSVESKLSIRDLSEDVENALIGGMNKPGKFVMFGPKHSPTSTLRIAVHGIHAAPNTIEPVVDRGLKMSDQVHVYNYSDMYRGLTDVSEDLFKSIKELLFAKKYTTLTLDAYSSGARVAVHVINKLQNDEFSKKLNFKVNLIAPVLTGTETANSAKHAPWPITMIPMIRVGKDMGSESKFQRELENIKFDSNISTLAIIGEKDHLVDSTDPLLNKILVNINSKTVILEGHDHNTLLEEAANTIEKNN